MKKRFLSMMLVIALLLSIAGSAYAAEPRSSGVTPSLTFTGTTANCSVTVMRPGVDIEITMTLYRELSVIASWSGSGSSVVKLSKTAEVKNGLEYRLVVTGTINGVPFTSAPVYGTC